MTIGPGTKADIERAIRQFDAELRDTPDWADWESNNNYKYALLENGERYPLKKIISLATGTPLDISGQCESGQEGQSADIALGRNRFVLIAPH